MNAVRLAGCSLVLLALAGCGGKVGTVSGKVTYRGQEVPAGLVTFYGPDNSVLRARINPDGTFTAERVPAGEVRVSVDVPQPPPVPRTPAVPGGPVDPRVGLPTVPIPRRYADPNSSGLVLTVHSGAQNYPIELKD